MPAAGADGQPHRHLGRPCDGAGQQPVCNVHARDEEHENGHPQQQPERQLDVREDSALPPGVQLEPESLGF
jgi:hypothetical protein